MKNNVFWFRGQTGILHDVRVVYAWIFFDELNSTDPSDCKTNECHSVPLGHFPKMKQIQNDRFFAGALTEKSFDVIKYS